MIPFIVDASARRMRVRTLRFEAVSYTYDGAMAAINAARICVYASDTDDGATAAVNALRAVGFAVTMRSGNDDADRAERKARREAADADAERKLNDIARKINDDPELLVLARKALAGD